MEENSNNKFLTAGAIIMAGVIIASAIIYSQKSSTDQVAQVYPDQQEETPTLSAEDIQPVTKDDHIIGKPDAELSLIVYFDVNCFYCKKFHETLTQYFNEYGKEGKIKWVSRHFPLNPFSQLEAEATECAADVGGKEKYWEYLNSLIKNPIEPQDQEGNESKLTALAEKFNINKKGFESCLKEGRYSEKITKSREEAINSGAQGTPFGVIMGPDRAPEVISGALEFEELKSFIEAILEN